jgi:hypothetical protein
MPSKTPFISVSRNQINADKSTLNGGPAQSHLEAGDFLSHGVFSDGFKNCLEQDTKKTATHFMPRFVSRSLKSMLRAIQQTSLLRVWNTEGSEEQGLAC